MINALRWNIHGNWGLRLLDDQVLLVRVSSGWNKEAALQFSLEFKEATQPFHGQPWAILLSTRNAELVIPEAIPIVKELNTWAIEHGCCCEAELVKNIMQIKQIEETRSDSSGHSYVQKCFLDIKDAAAFMSEHGFELSCSFEEADAWLSSTDDY